MSALLLRSSLRFLLRHPGQLVLSVAGVALGVAVVVSIDLANASASRAFALSTESVAGRATHRVTGGPGGLPDEVFRDLVVDVGVEAAAPVIEGYATVAPPTPPPTIPPQETASTLPQPNSSPQTPPFETAAAGDLLRTRRESGTGSPPAPAQEPAAPPQPPTSPEEPPSGGVSKGGVRNGEVSSSIGNVPSIPRSTGDAPSDIAPRVLRLLGVDPLSEAPFRPYLARFDVSGGADGDGPDLATFLTGPRAVFLSASTAADLGISPGDELPIRVASRRDHLRVAGLLAPADELSRQALTDLAVMDVATAQEVLGLPGRLSHVDLIVPEGASGEALLERIRAALPRDARLAPTGARQQTTQQMTRAFRLNLTALSLLALLCGLFLIYNAMTFSVVQRRTLLGTLRALGVTRRQVFALVLGEAAAIALVGTAAGLALGVVLGRGMVELVTRTLNDLYFVLTVTDLALDPASLAKGAALGLLATLAAAVPAREATSAPPRSALTRSQLETGVRRALPRITLVAVALLTAGAALLAVPARALLPGFVGLFAVIVGFALLAPLATVGLMRLLRPVAGRLFGILGTMAARGVVASLSRTAVAIAALAIAVSVTVGVGVMVDSFRGTVERWLSSALGADVYVSPTGTAGGAAAFDAAPLDPVLEERFAAVPGVAAVHTVRRSELAVGAEEPTRLVSLELDREGFRDLDLRQGEPEAVWHGFVAGGLIVSEPYAFHRGLAVGDTVELPTPNGPRRFPVVAVYASYASDRGVALVARTTFEAVWGDRSLSGLSVDLAPGATADELIPRLRHAAGPEWELVFQSSRALREASLEVFDRTFLITGVLRLLAGLVAFIGVVSALMALQLERARELGVLRANGLTPRQVWGLVTSQTGLMGLVAGLLSVPVGLVLAAVMIFVINRRSFGWTLQMAVEPRILVEALLLALAAALLAGLYPAWKMSRTPPAVALREE